MSGGPAAPAGSAVSLTPQVLFGRVAVAEACTWALLLLGMVLKYVPPFDGLDLTDDRTLGALAVSIFGMAHGVVFLGYCVTVVVLAVDQRWTPVRTLVGLAAAVPPFATVWFDRAMVRRGAFGPWRLRHEEPAGPLDRVVARLIRRPVQGVLTAVLVVAVLTGVALVVGPPVG